MNSTGPSLLSSLLLVAFGGIFGTILTLVVTWWRDRLEKGEERRGKLQWILAEIMDNLEHVKKYNLAGGRAKAKLLTQAWEATKGDMGELSQEVVNSIRVAYAEVWRFNGVVEYDLVKIPPGNGTLDSALEAMAGIVESALEDAKTKLSKHMGKQEYGLRTQATR